jgi:hypothetical protein
LDNLIYGQIGNDGNGHAVAPSKVKPLSAIPWLASDGVDGTAHSATDIRAGGGVARLTGLYPGPDGMQRGQVTGQTFQVGSHRMDLVTRRFRDLGPAAILAHVAIFAHLAGKLGVGGCPDIPAPSNAIRSGHDRQGLADDMYGSLPGYGGLPARSAKPSP